MSELIPGLIVERMIPPEVWGGLMTGKYDLFGGVVRMAKGLQKYPRYLGEITR